MDVTASMVQEAANEVQLGEHQVRRLRWPWLLGAATAVVVALGVMTWGDWLFDRVGTEKNLLAAQPAVTLEEQPPAAELAEPRPEEVIEAPLEAPLEVILAELDSNWLINHQGQAWQGLAQLWKDPAAAFAIQAACNGDNSSGYACLNDQGSWSKIQRLGLPVLLQLQIETPSLLLLQGVDGDRLLVGSPGELTTVSKDSVESRWLGSYLVAWPQAEGWPAEVGRGGGGAAVATIMEMAGRVDVPYQGEPVFDGAFEYWLKSFQARNGLDADGIVGRNTLLHLMTASIDEPKLLTSWER
jgi:peptidoglycan hydrolase-like protein with peptidoglycan-binding domain